MNTSTTKLLLLIAGYSLATSAMDRFDRPRNPITVFWNDTTKCWVYKIYKTTRKNVLQSIINLATAAPASHNTTCNIGHQQNFSTNLPMMQHTPATEQDIFLALCRMASPLKEDTGRTIETIHEFIANNINLSALRQFSHSYTSLIPDKTVVRIIDNLDSITEKIMALLPQLSADAMSSSLLLSSAQVFESLEQLCPGRAAYYQRCRALCTYQVGSWHANNRMILDAWKLFAALFDRDKTDALAGVFSTTITLLMKENPTIARDTISFEDYIQQSIDLIKTQIDTEIATTTFPLLRPLLEQIAYSDRTTIKINALQLLHILAEHSNDELCASQYEQQLTPLLEENVPHFRPDITYGKHLSTIITDTSSPEEIINYLNAIEAINIEVEQYDLSVKKATHQFLLNCLNQTIAPVIKKSIDDAHIPMLESILNHCKKSRSLSADQRETIVIPLLTSLETGGPEITTDVMACLETQFDQKELGALNNIVSSLIYGYILVYKATVHDMTITQADYSDTALHIHEKLLKFVQSLQKQSLDPSFATRIAGLTQSAYEFFIFSAQNNGYLLQERLRLCNYAAQLGYPHSEVKKATIILRAVFNEQSRYLEKNRKKLLNQALELLEKNGSAKALIQLAKVYFRGIPLLNSLEYLVEKNLNKSYEYIKKGYTQYPDNPKLCYWMAAVSKSIPEYADDDIVLKYLTQAIENPTPYYKAYIDRATLYFKQKRYIESYADFQAYLNSGDHSYDNAKLLRNLALWDSGIIQMQLHNSITELVSNWHQIACDKSTELYSVRESKFTNQELQRLIQLTSPDIIKNLATIAKEKQALGCCDDQTINLCYILWRISQNSTLIAESDSHDFYHYCVVKNHTQAMLDFLPYLVTHKTIGTLLWHSLYQLKAQQIDDQTITDMIQSMGITVKTGDFASQLYSLLLLNQIANGQELEAVFASFNPISIINPFITHGYTALQDMEKTPILGFMKKCSDQLGVSQTGITNATIRIGLYYALIYANALHDPLCPATSFQDYFIIAAQALDQVEKYGTITKFFNDSLREPLYTLLTGFITNDIDNNTKSSLLSSAMQNQDRLAYLKLAFVYLFGNSAIPSNNELALLFFQKAGLSNMVYAPESYEYYQAKALSHILDKKLIPQKSNTVQPVSLKNSST